MNQTELNSGYTHNRAARTCFNGSRPPLHHSLYDDLEELVIAQGSIANDDGIVEVPAGVGAGGRFAIIQDRGVVAMEMMEPQFVGFGENARLHFGRTQKIWREEKKKRKVGFRNDIIE